MTSWGEYQSAIDRLLPFAAQELRIYDQDLSKLGLESSERCDKLRQLVLSGKGICIKIAVRDANYFRNHAPRLFQLLQNFGHRMSLQETPENLAHLRDGMMIADDCHALILFDQEQARSKLVTDDPEETRPYLYRFEEIWQAGCRPVSASTIGL